MVILSYGYRIYIYIIYIEAFVHYIKCIMTGGEVIITLLRFRSRHFCKMSLRLITSYEASVGRFFVAERSEGCTLADFDLYEEKYFYKIRKVVKAFSGDGEKS